MLRTEKLGVYKIHRYYLVRSGLEQENFQSIRIALQDPSRNFPTKLTALSTRFYRETYCQRVGKDRGGGLEWGKRERRGKDESALTWPAAILKTEVQRDNQTTGVIDEEIVGTTLRHSLIPFHRPLLPLSN